MTLTWADMKGTVRRTLLHDTTPDTETGQFIFTDDSLLDCVKWALETFAQHTAIATATSFTVIGQTYTMPDNLLTTEPLDINGLVYLVDDSGCKTYLDPVRYTPGLSIYDGDGFYTSPDTVLHLSTQPKANQAALYVAYFAYYDEPFNDNSLIGLPRWAIPAVSYLVAAYALSGASTATASIRQWGAKPDTGTPDDNPILQQYQVFLAAYQAEITRHTVQDRASHWRLLMKGDDYRA